MHVTLATVILGIVEGLTEFIPVSSTAHLLLTGTLLGTPKGQLLEVLSICIQSGAILAAVWYFWHTIWSNLSLIPKVIVAFLPTAIIGVTLYPLIKIFLGSTTLIAMALIVGGIILLFMRPIDTDTDVLAAISYKQAFLIGLTQTLSFIPGVSRAGATLIGGTALKIPRQTIVPFSFLLGIPTILGASVVELRHVPPLASGDWALIGLGTVVSAIVALATIRFFITLLTKKPLSWFGWYRIVVGVLILIFL
jgi:undecaprenyl-diphosphatase